jgi:hypothetical protein
MISSDLHGAEEPIRWLLGWQRQDNVMMSPCMKKTEGRPHQDTLAEIDLGGITPCRWMMALMDRTPPRAGWTFSGACGSVLGLVWHMWQVAGAPEGPTFCLLDADDAQKGPTSPSEGPDVSLFSSFLTF